MGRYYLGLIMFRINEIILINFYLFVENVELFCVNRVILNVENEVGRL